MDYTQAREAARSGKPVFVGITGGRKRYVRFYEAPDGSVDVQLFVTTIVRFWPDRIELDTGGYETITTSEALNALVPGGRFWRDKGVLIFHPHDGSEPRPFVDGRLVLTPNTIGSTP